ncbi:hypothetical protein BDZ97DRAFT_1648348 [Flammula alnicola]|nr:hypothetical protein BDZ97DRAFT_1648348 [Flammula alnicola]
MFLFRPISIFKRAFRSGPSTRLHTHTAPRRTNLRLLSTKPSTPRCPSCSRPLPSNLPACTVCWSIHPLPPNISHHDLFGLPSEPNPFVLDLHTLKKRFLEAQAACHPDAWASKSPKEGDLAHTLSSRINQAYQCLLHPLSRAEYILEQHGLQMSESDQVEDMEFMMEIMEARETIDDAIPENRDTIEKLVDSNQQDIKRTIDEITKLVEQQDWPQVKSATIRLRYLDGIHRAAKRWMDNNT